ncbi:MAG TPA: hypothetical protein VKT77_15435 [Chthonomonadaceae bacterium]|nr:hypothetical protein [Chthonomonadaceae bacterium]
MAANGVILPAGLAHWIDFNMPELGGMRGVRLRCCDRLPFTWAPGFLRNVQGLTLWNTVYLKRGCCEIDPQRPESIELLLHELVHVGQFRRGPLSFPVRYLIDFARLGYLRIPAEREARSRAAELLARYLAGPFEPA